MMGALPPNPRDLSPFLPEWMFFFFTENSVYRYNRNA
jgi:hypothetical protein